MEFMKEATPKIDLDRLEKLLSSRLLVQKYITKFLEFAPQYFSQMSDAIQRSDLEALQVASHSLRTQFRYLDHKEAEHALLFFEEQLESDEINSFLNQQRLASFKLLLDETFQLLKKEQKLI